MKTKTFPPASQFADLDTEGTPSHAVRRVERYTMDGKEFETFAKAIEHRENLIEAEIRHLFRGLPAQEQIEKIQWVLDNRKLLCHLLNY